MLKQWTSPCSFNSEYARSRMWFGNGSRKFIYWWLLFHSPGRTGQWLTGIGAAAAIQSTTISMCPWKLGLQQRVRLGQFLMRDGICWCVSNATTTRRRVCSNGVGGSKHAKLRGGRVVVEWRGKWINMHFKSAIISSVKSAMQKLIIFPSSRRCRASPCGCHNSQDMDWIND